MSLSGSQVNSSLIGIGRAEETVPEAIYPFIRIYGYYYRFMAESSVNAVLISSLPALDSTIPHPVVRRLCLVCFKVTTIH